MMPSHHSNIVALGLGCCCLLWLLMIAPGDGCISLLDGWKPMSIERRTELADIVVAGHSVERKALPGHRFLYAATFKVNAILKGWHMLESLYRKRSRSVFVTSTDSFGITVSGFGDRRYCFSSVDVGENYILFIGYKNNSDMLVAKYDDIFGAAEVAYKSTEDLILNSQGWRQWTSWSGCSSSCGGGYQSRTRRCQSETCLGPPVEQKQCAKHDCRDSYDVLTFVIRQNVQSRIRKRFAKHRLNATDQHLALYAPTYFLIRNPINQQFSILLSFQGPVTEPMFAFSIYDANERIQFGVKIHSNGVEAVYSFPNDLFNERRSQFFKVDLDYYDAFKVQVSMQGTLLSVATECKNVGRVTLPKDITKEFDLFGKIFIGADTIEGNSRYFKGVLSELQFINAPMPSIQYCNQQSFLEYFRSGNRQEAPVITVSPRTIEEASGRGDDNESGDFDDNEVGEDGAHSGDGADDTGSTLIDVQGSVDVCDVICLNGGQCVGSTCQCAPNWQGNDCSKPLCLPFCENGGTCMANDTCVCKPGYVGDRCQTVLCKSPCLNGGKCIAKDTCSCPDRYYGHFCQHRICRGYVTVLVTYYRPAIVASIQPIKTPCGLLSMWECVKKRTVYKRISKVAYKQEYRCIE